MGFDPLPARILAMLHDALVPQPLCVGAGAAYLLLRLRVSGRSCCFVHNGASSRSCWAFVHNGAHRCLHGRWGFSATHFSSRNSGMICNRGGGEKRKFTSVSVDHNNISVHYNGNNQKLCCSSITIQWITGQPDIGTL